MNDDYDEGWYNPPVARPKGTRAQRRLTATRREQAWRRYCNEVRQLLMRWHMRTMKALAESEAT